MDFIFNNASRSGGCWHIAKDGLKVTDVPETVKHEVNEHWGGRVYEDDPAPANVKHTPFTYTDVEYPLDLFGHRLYGQPPKTRKYGYIILGRTTADVVTPAHRVAKGEGRCGVGKMTESTLYRRSWSVPGLHDKKNIGKDLGRVVFGKVIPGRFIVNAPEGSCLPEPFCNHCRPAAEKEGYL